MASSTFKVGQNIRVARDNYESAFVRTGARGVVVPWPGYPIDYYVLVKVREPSDILRATGWGNPLYVAVPVDALERVDGLLDI